MKKTCVLLMAVLLASMAGISLLEAKDGDPDFSGTWAFNKEKSDPMPSGRGRGGGRGGRGGRGGPGFDPDMTLVIVQDGDRIEVTRKGSRGETHYTLKPGGGQTEIETPRGVAVVDAEWRENTLVVVQNQEMETPRGTMKIRQEQYWNLSSDGRTLTQKVKIDGGPRSFEGKLVFDKK